MHLSIKFESEQFLAQVESEQPISLIELGAKIYPGHVEGLYPVLISSPDKDILPLVISVIKSCMIDFAPKEQLAPWEKIVERLQGYKLDYEAYVYPKFRHVTVLITESQAPLYFTQVQ